MNAFGSQHEAPGCAKRLQGKAMPGRQFGVSGLQKIYIPVSWNEKEAVTEFASHRG